MSATAPIADRREAFHRLHAAGTFVMPNAWDPGSARVLADVGFPAVATTSSGHGMSVGRGDMSSTLDELLAHVAAVVGAVDVPVSVDSERCFADDPAGVARTVAQLAEAGAAGCSIEDWDPSRGTTEELGAAVERVAAAAEAADRTGMVLTARADRHLHEEAADLGETIARLCAFRDAGAHCVYAPGRFTAEQVGRIVGETGTAVNVLALRPDLRVPDLAALGVRRISTGGALAFDTYDHLRHRATAMLDTGTFAHLAERG